MWVSVSSTGKVYCFKDIWSLITRTPKNQFVYWSDNKKQSLRTDVISWNYKLKEQPTQHTINSNMEYCKSQQGTASTEIENLAYIYISVSTIDKRLFNYLPWERVGRVKSQRASFCSYIQQRCETIDSGKLGSKWSERSESLWVVTSGTGCTMHMQCLCYADMSFDVHMLTSFYINKFFPLLVYKRWQVLPKNDLVNI